MNHGIDLFAEALVFVHGRKAESEAARHAMLCETSGDSETAETWRKLQQAVRDFNNRSECLNRKAA